MDRDYNNVFPDGGDIAVVEREVVRWLGYCSPKANDFQVVYGEAIWS